MGEGEDECVSKSVSVRGCEGGRNDGMREEEVGKGTALALPVCPVCIVFCAGYHSNCV